MTSLALRPRAAVRRRRRRVLGLQQGSGRKVLIIMVPEHHDAVLDGVVRLDDGAGVAVVIAVANNHTHT